MPDFYLSVNVENPIPNKDSRPSAFRNCIFGHSYEITSKKLEPVKGENSDICHYRGRLLNKFNAVVAQTNRIKLLIAK